MLNTRKARLMLAATVAVAVVVAFGIGGWWFFIRDDAPEAVSQETVCETLEEESDGSAAETPDEADEAGDAGSVEVAGEWTIDPSIGSFDDFSGTFVGYRIDEELANIGGQTTVGRTPDVTGSATIEDSQVTAVAFEANMTTLRSDQGLRDSALKTRGLETDTFPTASFELTAPLDIPEGAASCGDPVDFEAEGRVTLHGVTNDVTIAVTAQLVDGTIGINGSTAIVLADYEIDPPTGLSVVSVADQGTLEFQLFLRRS